MHVLTVITILANLADDKLTKFFLFFPENRLLHFMQIVSKKALTFHAN